MNSPRDIEPAPDGLSRRKLLWMAGAAGVSLALPGCGGHKKSSSPSYKSDYTYRFPNSTTDGRIFVATSKKGDEVIYFGDKDTKGNATSLRAAFVTTDGATNYLYYDPSNIAGKVVTRMITGNGVTFDLDWMSKTTASLKITHPATGTSISTPLDFAAKAVPRRTVYSSAKRFGTPLRSAKSPLAVVKPKALGATGNCLVNVTRCGMPDPSFADVYVSVSKQGLNVAYATYPAYPTGTTGQYVASIPTGNAKLLSLKDAALAAIDVVDKGGACTAWGENNATAALEYFCLTVSEAVASVPDGFNQAAAAAFLSACTIINTAITLTCEALESPLGKFVLSGLEELLEDGVEDINVDLTQQIDLTAKIAALPSAIFGSTVTAPITGPFSNLTVSAGAGTQISGLVLDPSAPSAGEPYIATATVLCLTPGEVVTMHILGTDGYENSVTYSVTEAGQSQGFDLPVPGAAQGVRDTVDVTVSGTGQSDLHTSGFLIFR